MAAHCLESYAVEHNAAALVFAANACGKKKISENQAARLARSKDLLGPGLAYAEGTVEVTLGVSTEVLFADWGAVRKRRFREAQAALEAEVEEQEEKGKGKRRRWWLWPFSSSSSPPPPPPSNERGLCVAGGAEFAAAMKAAASALELAAAAEKEAAATAAARTEARTVEALGEGKGKGARGGSETKGHGADPGRVRRAGRAPRPRHVCHRRHSEGGVGGGEQGAGRGGGRT